MGCCGSSSVKAADEKTGLLQNEPNFSNQSRSQSQSHSITFRPPCHCGKKMNAYELQCCYLNENGDPFTGSINCDECGKAMCDPNDIVWHCLLPHDNTYDLCFDCGTNKAAASNPMYHEEKKQAFPIHFDPKHNTQNVDWNELYLMMCDEAKAMTIHKILTENLDLSNIESYNLAPDIIEFIHTISSQVKMTQIVHNSCTEDIGWTVQVDQDEICIKYKKEENTLFHSIKSNFVCQSSVLDFIAVLNEFDLMGDLLKLVPVQTKMLKEFTNSHKVVYMNIGMWWPLKDRDFIIHVNACDATEEFGEVILWGNSPKDDKIEGVDNIPSAEECGSLRVDIVRLEVVCKPIRFGVKNKKDLTRIIMIYNVDFKSYMPVKLVNWVGRTFAYSLVKVMRDRCENLKGTEHEKRINSKDIYRKWRLGLMDWQKRKLIKDKAQKQTLADSN